MVLPRFSMAAPDLGALTLEVAGDRRLVGAWNVSLAASQLDDEVGGEQLVTVAALSSLTVRAGGGGVEGDAWPSCRYRLNVSGTCRCPPATPAWAPFP